MSKDAKKSLGVPNVERALSILELLSERAEGLTLTEICQELGYPNNSVFRITQSLISRDYILRDEKSKKFSLSRKLLSLAYTALHEHNIVRLSWDTMKELRDDIGESVLIATTMEQYGHGVVLEQIASKHAFKFVVDPGTRFPLHASAPGKAHLAFLSKVAQIRVCNTLNLEKFNENTITTLDELYKEFDLIRKDGYAIDREEERRGVVCLGAPIIDYHGIPVASIFLTGPTNRITPEKYEEIGNKVSKAALQISHKLGWVKETLYMESD